MTVDKEMTNNASVDVDADENINKTITENKTFYEYKKKPEDLHENHEVLFDRNVYYARLWFLHLDGFDASEFSIAEVQGDNFPKILSSHMQIQYNQQMKELHKVELIGVKGLLTDRQKD